MIGHHKHILLTGINGIDALVSLKKHHFPPFLELKVIFSIGLDIDSHNNLLSLHDWNHKHILLVRINDIDALVSEEKLLLLQILELKYVFQLR